MFLALGCSVELNNSIPVDSKLLAFKKSARTHCCIDGFLLALKMINTLFCVALGAGLILHVHPIQYQRVAVVVPLNK